MNVQSVATPVRLARAANHRCCVLEGSEREETALRTEIVRLPLPRPILSATLEIRSTDAVCCSSTPTRASPARAVLRYQRLPPRSPARYGPPARSAPDRPRSDDGGIVLQARLDGYRLLRPCRHQRRRPRRRGHRAVGPARPRRRPDVSAARRRHDRRASLRERWSLAFSSIDELQSEAADFPLVASKR